MEVLQKELVQVQTLMDRMTREREEESERLENQYKELQANYTTSEVRRLKHLTLCLFLFSPFQVETGNSDSILIRDFTYRLLCLSSSFFRTELFDYYSETTVK